MTDYVALNDLRLKARQRSDQVNSQFVTDSELDGYVNNSYSELYDIIVSRYDDDYFLTSYALTVSSGTASYDLPSDFYKARGVDLIISTNESTPLQRYVFADRTRDSLARYARDVKYRIQGNKIHFAPAPDSNTATLWYIPKPRKLQSATPSVVSRGSTTTYTVPYTHSFAVGDRLNLVDFINTGYNVEQTVTAVTSVTVVTDLDSTGLADPTTIGTLNSMVDLFNAGWQEYIELDSAIKCLVKGEEDPTAMLVLKGQLRDRIFDMSETRDSGEPPRVTNVASYESYFLY